MPFAAEPSHVSDTFRLLKSSSLNIFILNGYCDIDLVGGEEGWKSRLANKKVSLLQGI